MTMVGRGSSGSIVRIAVGKQSASEWCNGIDGEWAIADDAVEWKWMKVGGSKDAMAMVVTRDWLIVCVLMCAIMYAYVRMWNWMRCNPFFFVSLSLSFSFSLSIYSFLMWSPSVCCTMQRYDRCKSIWLWSSLLVPPWPHQRHQQIRLVVLLSSTRTVWGSRSSSWWGGDDGEKQRQGKREEEGRVQSTAGRGRGDDATVTSQSCSRDDRVCQRSHLAVEIDTVDSMVHCTYQCAIEWGWSHHDNPHIWFVLIVYPWLDLDQPCRPNDIGSSLLPSTPMLIVVVMIRPSSRVCLGRSYRHWQILLDYRCT